MRDAVRSFRLDRTRSARLLDEVFERRPDFEPLSDRRPVTILYLSGEGARRRLERPKAQELSDRSVLVEDQAGEDWLVGEILAHRGEALLLKPDDLRRRIAHRARELSQELGLSRLRISV